MVISLYAQGAKGVHFQGHRDKKKKSVSLFDTDSQITTEVSLYRLFIRGDKVQYMDRLLKKTAVTLRHFQMPHRV